MTEKSAQKTPPAHFAPKKYLVLQLLADGNAKVLAESDELMIAFLEHQRVYKVGAPIFIVKNIKYTHSVQEVKD